MEKQRKHPSTWFNTLNYESRPTERRETGYTRTMQVLKPDRWFSRRQAALLSDTDLCCFSSIVSTLIHEGYINERKGVCPITKRKVGLIGTTIEQQKEFKKRPICGVEQ